MLPPSQGDRRGNEKLKHRLPIQAQFNGLVLFVTADTERHHENTSVTEYSTAYPNNLCII